MRMEPWWTAPHYINLTSERKPHWQNLDLLLICAHYACAGAMILLCLCIIAEGSFSWVFTVVYLMHYCKTWHKVLPKILELCFYIYCSCFVFLKECTIAGKNMMTTEHFLWPIEQILVYCRIGLYDSMFKLIIFNCRIYGFQISFLRSKFW